jgi:anthranilate/para-aminobenzoate synthase component I
MKADQIRIPSFPEAARDIFFVPASSSTSWRELLAMDPQASFVLERIQDLPELIAFLESNKEGLCAGFLSYDLGMALMQVPSRHQRDVPLAVFHAYSTWAEKTSAGWMDETGALVEVNYDQHSHGTAHLDLSPEMDKATYGSAIAKIHSNIRAGEFYQLNLTQRLSGKSPMGSRQLFKHLVHQHPAEHACYFEASGLSLHSLSPELFLRHQNGHLMTQPIKGTRPRGQDPESDTDNRDELLNSAKEQAELFMITDLLRNDLGKISEIGSVKLTAIKELKKLQKVWHTFSQIEGQLLKTLTPLQGLLSMLPGGSITGCPKKRSMEAIDELEISPRGVYTGSLGYILPDGEFSFNIAIRTLVQKDEALSLGTGGGITIDSEWEAEWEELLVKASTFQSTIDHRS